MLLDLVVESGVPWATFQAQIQNKKIYGKRIFKRILKKIFLYFKMDADKV